MMQSVLMDTFCLIATTQPRLSKGYNWTDVPLQDLARALLQDEAVAYYLDISLAGPTQVSDIVRINIFPIAILLLGCMRNFPQACENA